MPENSRTVGFRLLLPALSPVALDSSNSNTRAEDSNPPVTIERSLGPVQPAIIETANLVSES